MYQDTVCQV